MMTPRPLARMRTAPRKRIAIGAATIAAALALASTGCDPRTALYFLQPFGPKIDATGPDLRGKTVVILPIAAAGASLDAPSIDRDIAKELAAILKSEVRRIKIIPHSKVSQWLESHVNWTEPAEIAKDLKADVVLLLEIEEFKIRDPNSPGMYQGVSKVHLQATQLKPAEDENGKTKAGAELEPEVVYDETEETVFPERGPQPADSKITPTVFRSKFLKTVVQEISWHFVQHEFGDTIQDTRF